MPGVVSSHIEKIFHVTVGPSNEVKLLHVKMDRKYALVEFQGENGDVLSRVFAAKDFADCIELLYKEIEFFEETFGYD